MIHTVIQRLNCIISLKVKSRRHRSAAHLLIKRSSTSRFLDNRPVQTMDRVQHSSVLINDVHQFSNQDRIQTIQHHTWAAIWPQARNLSHHHRVERQVLHQNIHSLFVLFWKKWIAHRKLCVHRRNVDAVKTVQIEFAVEIVAKNAFGKLEKAFNWRVYNKKNN